MSDSVSIVWVVLFAYPMVAKPIMYVVPRNR